MIPAPSVGLAGHKHSGTTAHRGKYHAILRHGGRQYYAGRWPTRREAAIARDRLVLHFGADRALNLPQISRKRGPASALQLRREARLLARATATGPKAASPYFGVYWFSRDGSWEAWVRIGQRKVVVGRFADPVRAARVRDRVLLHLWRLDPSQPAPVLNFPEAREAPISVARARAKARRLLKQRLTSRYLGVYRDASKPGRPWGAALSRARGVLFLGRYRSQQAAATAHDRAALHYDGQSARLNFPARASKLEPADARMLRDEAYRELKTSQRSRFRGVAPVSRGHKWFAVVHHDRQRHYLGVFDTEEEAALAYDRAALRIKPGRLRLNFHPVTGQELCGKWFEP